MKRHKPAKPGRPLSAQQTARMQQAVQAHATGQLAVAEAGYRSLIAENEHFHVAMYMLANILKSQGKLDEAAAFYQEIMVLEPGYTQAHFSYSGIHKYKDRSDPHINLMLDVQKRTALSDENRIHLDFALAKAFEDLGDYAQAFGYLKSGNDLRSREFNYDIASDAALIQSIMKAFSRDAISRLRINAETSNRPIFIVGMPRSGTSLVEKILASHSEVYGAGELDYMFALGTSRFLGESNNFEYQSLDSYAQSTFEEVGKTYLEKIRLLNDEASRITDKMPFNMMMVGLIKIALPNAKIVHCVRDARDTCLSIFKQNFTTGNYRFAYNLKAVAQFHNQYRVLMRHWHETMPGAIYDISYEALTQDPEHEIRKLLSACDLEFQESCVSFNKTEAVVKTASAFQVRQPMYTSSISLWEKYEQFLGPMLDELKAGQGRQPDADLT